jgi:hypothetical protein
VAHAVATGTASSGKWRIDPPPSCPPSRRVRSPALEFHKLSTDPAGEWGPDDAWLSFDPSVGGASGDVLASAPNQQSALDAVKPSALRRRSSTWLVDRVRGWDRPARAGSSMIRRFGLVATAARSLSSRASTARSPAPCAQNFVKWKRTVQGLMLACGVAIDLDVSGVVELVASQSPAADPCQQPKRRCSSGRATSSTRDALDAPARTPRACQSHRREDRWRSVSG